MKNRTFAACDATHLTATAGDGTLVIKVFAAMVANFCQEIAGDGGPGGAPPSC